jgi:rhodanese-related sulfurtransferase
MEHGFKQLTYSNYLIQTSLYLSVLLTCLPIAKASTPDFQKTAIFITKDLHHIDVKHRGGMVRIQREQDPDHRLTNSFARTSRVCPPFCTSPFQIAPKVNVVGELELINFLNHKSQKGTGVLIDGRLPQWYAKATIPSAVNLPFPVFDNKIDATIVKRLLLLLGADNTGGNQWDFATAKELLIFGNGIWGIQSTKTIKNLLALGYPAEKIYWYRGGLQDWLQVGLTTVSASVKQDL